MITNFETFNFFATSINGIRGKLVCFDSISGIVTLRNANGEFEVPGIIANTLSAHMCDSSMNKHVTNYLIERGLPVYRNGKLIKNPDRFGKLLERLLMIEKGDIDVKADKYINDDYHGTLEVISDEETRKLALSLCCGDSPNVYGKLKLLQHGFSVFPINQIGRKWLVGGIKTSKGVVSFG